MTKTAKLAAVAHVHPEEFLHVETSYLKERVESELARRLGQEIIKSKFVEITERPDPVHYSKEFRAEVVVMSVDHYHELLGKSQAAEKAHNILSRNF